MNFHEFATKIKIINNKLHKQPDNVVPKEKTTHFIEVSLLRFKPWKASPLNAQNDQK